MMRKGYQMNLSVVEVANSNEPNLSEILVANEFFEVFKKFQDYHQTWRLSSFQT